MSIGNIQKRTRAAISQRAHLLLAYLPVTKFPNTEWPMKTQTQKMPGILSKRLFHKCVKIIVAGLTSKIPRDVIDSEGYMRSRLAELMAWFGDLEEEWMIACLGNNQCPQGCEAGTKDLGLPVLCAPRTGSSILAKLRTIRERLGPDANTWAFASACVQEGLCGVEDPCWEELGVDICRLLCQDPLHAYHKFLKDHPIQWLINVVGEAEVDARISRIPLRKGFRHFTNGVTSLSQWTCKETRDLERELVAAMADAPGANAETIRALRAVLDYIHLAEMRCHTDATLAHLTSAIADWNKFKHAFIRNGGRRGENGVINHFQIPKDHVPLHAVDQIRRTGSLEGTSSEIIETYHPEVAKKPFKNNNHNRKVWITQMIRSFNRQEVMYSFRAYINWVAGQPDIRVEDPAGLDVDDDAVVTGSKDIEGTGEADDGDPDSEDSAQWLSKRPTYSRVSIEEVAARFQSPNLITALRRYFQRIDPGSSSGIPAAYRELDIWTSVSVEVPVVNDLQDVVWRRVRATPTEIDQGGNIVGPCNSDTVLVQESDDAANIGLQGVSFWRRRSGS